jgi:hypothetical protein
MIDPSVFKRLSMNRDFLGILKTEGEFHPSGILLGFNFNGAGCTIK